MPSLQQHWVPRLSSISSFLLVNWELHRVKTAIKLSKGSGSHSCCQSLSFTLPFFFLTQTRGSQIEFSEWCHEPESSFFFPPVQLTRRADSACLHIWRSGSDSVPSYSVPILTFQYADESRPHVIVLEACLKLPSSTVLILQPGWGTLLMCLIKFCCHRELFYADLLTPPDAAVAKYFFFPPPLCRWIRARSRSVTLSNTIFIPDVVSVLTWTRTHGSVNSQGKESLWHAGGNCKVTSDAPTPSSFSNHWCSPMCDCLNMWLKWWWWRRWGSGEAQVLTSARL